MHRRPVGRSTMNAPLLQRQFTPEDLLTMPEGDRFELVDGRLVEHVMSMRSSRIGGRMYLLVGNFCEANPVGWLFPADTTFQCFPRFPNRVRKPDGAFIRLDRLTP